MARLNHWPWLRWCLLPLLLFLLGQYIEGPPYREIVRGAPFIISVFAVSLLAAQFLRQAGAFPKWLTPLQSLLAPSLFILTSHHYYNGGTNSSVSLLMVITSLLMGLNLVVYFISLFSVKQPEPSPQCDAPSSEPYYKIELRQLSPDGKPGSIKYHEEGRHAPPGAIVIDGFSRDQAIDLSDYWTLLANDALDYLEVPITVRETIVKFGETQQLVDDYLLRIKSDKKSKGR